MTRLRFRLLVLAMVLIPVAAICVALVRMRSFPTSMHIVLDNEDGSSLVSGTLHMKTGRICYQLQRDAPFLVAYSQDIVADSSLQISPEFLRRLSSFLGQDYAQKFTAEIGADHGSHLLNPDYVDSTGSIHIKIGLPGSKALAGITLDWKDHSKHQRQFVTVTDVQR